LNLLLLRCAARHASVTWPSGSEGFGGERIERFRLVSRDGCRYIARLCSPLDPRARHAGYTHQQNPRLHLCCQDKSPASRPPDPSSAIACRQPTITRFAEAPTESNTDRSTPVEILIALMRSTSYFRCDGFIDPVLSSVSLAKVAWPRATHDGVGQRSSTLMF